METVEVSEVAGRHAMRPLRLFLPSSQDLEEEDEVSSDEESVPELDAGEGNGG